MIGKIADAIFTALFVGIGMYTLAFLDKHPVPFDINHLVAEPLAKAGIKGFDTKIADVKFYAPPLAAVCFGFMNAKTFPALYTTFFGIIIGVGAACATVEFAHLAPLPANLKEDPMILRAATVAASTLAMKLVGAPFAPAAALAAVFFDNKAFQASVGRAYVLTPGLTGSIVLFFLAIVKITISSMFEGKAKVAPSGSGKNSGSKKKKN